MNGGGKTKIYTLVKMGYKNIKLYTHNPAPLRCIPMFAHWHLKHAEHNHHVSSINQIIFLFFTAIRLSPLMKNYVHIQRVKTDQGKAYGLGVVVGVFFLFLISRRGGTRSYMVVGVPPYPIIQ